MSTDKIAVNSLDVCVCVSVCVCITRQAFHAWEHKVHERQVNCMSLPRNARALDAGTNGSSYMHQRYSRLYVKRNAMKVSGAGK